MMGLLSPLAMAEVSTETLTDSSQLTLLTFKDALKSSDLSEKDQKTLGCKLQVLGEMGWELQSSSGLTSITPLTDTDGCSDVAPVLGVPASIEDASSVESALNRALTADPTFCKYKSLLKRAGETAARKLYSNSGFAFRQPQDPVCTFNSTGDWKNSYGGLTQPSGSRCEAIRALYNKSTKSDCAIGLHSIHMASQYELYGCDHFDLAFSNEDLTLGNHWGEVFGSDNIVYGAPREKFGTFYEPYDSNKHPESSADQFDPGAKQTAAKGRLALIGLGGYIGYKNEEHLIHLDDQSNKGQNFVILETSDEGARALSEKGTHGYDKPLEEAYKRMLKIYYKTKPDGSLMKRYIDNVTKNWLKNATDIMTDWLENSKRGSAIPALPTPYEPNADTEQMTRLMTEIMIILNDPFLRDTQVFVHPHEKMSLGHYVIYQLLENTRIPPAIVLYGSTVNTLLFTRHLEYKIEQCKTTQ